MPAQDTPSFSEDERVESDTPLLRLTDEEELQLHQLTQIQAWTASHDDGDSGDPQSGDDRASIPEPPLEWHLTGDAQLYQWQRECVDAWFTNGGRGVIKVVTGAGKTLLALSIAEALQRRQVPNLRVAIVVPTLVLLDQWHDELTQRSNLPSASVARLGGGHRGSFAEPVRILIAVLNSASRKLPSEVDAAGIGDSLLLIVDECHRAGSAEMRRVFGTTRAFSLGLSATPERDDDDDATTDEVAAPKPFEESVIGRELGRVIYEMTYADAIKAGILPPFRVVHYGLSLTESERGRYDRISREISDLRSELQTKSRRGLALVRWCRAKAAIHPQAARYVALTSERKRFLYRIGARGQCVTRILQTEFDDSPDAKAIIFHESIDEVMRLFAALRRVGLPVVAEHSEFSDELRAKSLRLFRRGIARIIVSARSLIEGFNVPSADIGIVMAASSSVRQRVQTLGRLLRRGVRADGTEKSATLYVLYGKGTVDEVIYEKANWDEFVGADRNEYYVWETPGEDTPTRCDGPPRTPPIDEEEVDVSSLRPRDMYPGDPNQGDVYSVDIQRTIRDEDGRLARPHPELAGILAEYRPSAGRFRITPKRRFVTATEPRDDGWQCIYLGQLSRPLEIASSTDEVTTITDSMQPGDEFPLEHAAGQTFSVLQRDDRLIAQKTGKSVRFVVAASELSSEREADLLRSLQRRLRETYSAGRQISKITVTATGDVVYVYQNRAFYLGKAPLGQAGFQFETPSPDSRKSDALGNSE